MKINWNNATSPQRNEIVFQGRNHHYGAFTIRSSYSRTMAQILFGMAIAAALAFLAHLLSVTKDNTPKLIPDEFFEYDFTPPTEKIPIPKIPIAQPPPLLESIKFQAYKIIDDARNDGPPTQEKLTDTQIGDQNLGGEKGDFSSRTEVDGGNGPVEVLTSEIYTIVNVMPEFPGGMAELQKYIQTHIQYPQLEKEAGISGKCFLRFVIEADGTIGLVDILQGIPGGKALDFEAQRVIKSMPNWTPGMNNGRPARVYFNMPINFQIK